MWDDKSFKRMWSKETRRKIIDTIQSGIYYALMACSTSIPALCTLVWKREVNETFLCYLSNQCSWSLSGLFFLCCANHCVTTCKFCSPQSNAEQWLQIFRRKAADTEFPKRTSEAQESLSTLINWTKSCRYNSKCYSPCTRSSIYHALILGSVKSTKLFVLSIKPTHLKFIRITFFYFVQIILKQSSRFCSPLSKSGDNDAKSVFRRTSTITLAFSSTPFLMKNRSYLERLVVARLLAVRPFLF